MLGGPLQQSASEENDDRVTPMLADMSEDAANGELVGVSRVEVSERVETFGGSVSGASSSFEFLLKAPVVSITSRLDLVGGDIIGTEAS